jgi:release factor glutamine methyltransferase
MSTDLPWTVGRLLDWTSSYLGQKGVESARLDAEVLLAHALSWKRIDLYTRYEEVPDEAQRQAFRELIRRRMEGCPVAYLVGRKEFFSLTLEVGPDVLIPRPDSECVVDECLRLARTLERPRILDIGTGSGNLAIALAVRHKTAEVTAVDVSDPALAVARRNAEKHGVAGRIRFLHGDLFGPLEAGELFDFIVSNPPYIPKGDIAGLERGVRDFEPHLALDGGADGFAVFDRLIAEASRWLKPGGYLLIEIGSPQEQRARARIESTPGYQLGPTLLDGSRHPRVLCARWQPAQ